MSRRYPTINREWFDGPGHHRLPSQPMGEASAIQAVCAG